MPRDGYSNFGFFQALSPDSYETATNGDTVDRRGYDTVTFVINIDDVDVSAATSNIDIIMEHGIPSAAGVSAWSVCTSAEIIGNGFSLGAAVTSGILYTFSISGTSVADLESQILEFGYRGDHRYVRLVVDSAGTADAGSVVMGAIAVLGNPANWPVNSQ
jgi:hypothetical protein